MMRTEAPNEREGRGLENLARTTPELPRSEPLVRCCLSNISRFPGSQRTVRAGDLAPDHADLGSTDLFLALVDERNLLAKVEAVSLSAPHSPPGPSLGDLLGGSGVVNTLDLDQAGLGASGVAGALVGKVATPMNMPVSLKFHLCPCLSQFRSLASSSS